MGEHAGAHPGQPAPTVLFAGDLNSDRNWGMPGALAAEGPGGLCPCLRSTWSQQTDHMQLLTCRGCTAGGLALSP